MGSDMSMEADNYRARPSYAEWDGDELVLYKDYWYSGFTEIWRGPVTGENEDLILLHVFNIPAKPVKPITPYEKTLALLKDYGISHHTAIAIATYVETYYEN